MINRIASAACFAALAAVLCAGPAPARAGSAARTPRPSPPAACDAEAYVTDKDPKGLNVRESPGAGGRIVAVIPADADGTVVHLVSSDSKGWVRIDRAETVGGEVVFKGEGWVSGNMLGTSTRGYGTRGVRLRAGARGAGVVGTIPPEAEVRISGCAGRSVRVKYGNLTGWLDADSHCPNPVTTCN